MKALNPFLRPVRARRAIAAAEVALIILLFALGAGAASFSLFLSSRDMRGAQMRSAWLKGVESLLDHMSIELQNAATVDFPFHGEGTQCLFRRPMADWTIAAGGETCGLIFQDNTLIHVVRNASGTNLPKAFQGSPNPLLSGVQAGKFERLGPRSLRISFRAAPPDTPGAMLGFERVVFLRNQ